MLEEITLRGLGVIAEATLPLSGGLTVLTGETGAGKTMVLSALALLCGGRADAGLVRPGSTQATVEGRLRLDPDSAAAARAREADADCDEDGALLVRRTVTSEGRSRAILGGVAVPAGVLAEVTASVITVHGQADQQRLTAPSVQREVLDRYGGAPVAQARDSYRDAFRQGRDLTDQLASLDDSAAGSAAQAEGLRAGIDRVTALAPQPGEDAELVAQVGRLAHVDALAGAAAAAHTALGGGEPDVAGGQTLLAEAAHHLAGAAGLDPEVAGLASRAAEAAILAGELQSDIAAYADGLAADPAALARAQDRRAALQTIARIYSPGQPDADGLRRWLDTAEDDLAALQNVGERRAALAADVASAQANLRVSAAALHDARARAARHLQAGVEHELAGLAFAGARLEVTVDSAPPAVHGADEISLLFAAHPSAGLRPLGRGASGGELSRVMLALEVVLAGADAVSCMVFDEVDAGVGGAAAVEVGARLARLAEHHQVLVVTHLPQVAAFADQHVRVEKDPSGAVVASDVRVLDAAERITELARMLAGQATSESARAHAAELVEHAAALRGA